MATYITTSVAYEAAWWSNRKNQTPPYELVTLPTRARPTIQNQLIIESEFIFCLPISTF